MIQIESKEKITFAKRKNYYKCHCCDLRRKSKQLTVFELECNGKGKVVLCDMCLKKIEEDEVEDKNVRSYVASMDGGFANWILHQPSNRDKKWYKKVYGS